jgi:hypothetical protein
MEPRTEVLGFEGVYGICRRQYADPLDASSTTPIYITGGSNMRRWFFVVAISLVVSNFLYQAITIENWELAFDRSWFQTIAVIVSYFTARIARV